MNSISIEDFDPQISKVVQLVAAINKLLEAEIIILAQLSADMRESSQASII